MNEYVKCTSMMLRLPTSDASPGWSGEHVASGQVWEALALVSPRADVDVRAKEIPKD